MWMLLAHAASANPGLEVFHWSGVGSVATIPSNAAGRRFLHEPAQVGGEHVVRRVEFCRDDAVEKTYLMVTFAEDQPTTEISPGRWGPDPAWRGTRDWEGDARELQAWYVAWFTAQGWDGATVTDAISDRPSSPGTFAHQQSWVFLRQGARVTMQRTCLDASTPLWSGPPSCSLILSPVDHFPPCR